MPNVERERIYNFRTDGHVAGSYTSLQGVQQGRSTRSTCFEEQGHAAFATDGGTTESPTAVSSIPAVDADDEDVCVYVKSRNGKPNIDSHRTAVQPNCIEEGRLAPEAAASTNG